MRQPSLLVQQETVRLLNMTAPQARAALNDRVTRTFLNYDPARLVQFVADLDFNAQLCTQLRLVAKANDRRTIWETV